MCDEVNVYEGSVPVFLGHSVHLIIMSIFVKRHKVVTSEALAA